MGISGVTLPARPDPAAADLRRRARRLREPSRRSAILFDNGAGGSSPGMPLPGFEQSFDALPGPRHDGRSWYLGRRRARRRKPAARTPFTWDPKARTATNFTGDTAAGEDGLWTATPPYQWQSAAGGQRRLLRDRAAGGRQTVIGAGYVRAWVKSPTPQRRPPGHDHARSGPTARRRSCRAAGCGPTSASSTPPRARRSSPSSACASATSRRCSAGGYTTVTIPLYYQGHAYRKGSRIRVLLTAPDGDQPIWAFKTSPRKPTTVTVRRRGSKLVLPVVPGVEVPTPLPPCPGLRGEPCRDFAG